MMCSRHRIHLTALAVIPALVLASTAMAQQNSSGGFLDNLFNRGQPQQAQQQPPQPREVAQDSGGNDVDSRIDRIEGALRQLTGTVEELQHQNQVLQMQLKRMQDDTAYHFQQMGARGAAPAAGPAAAPSRNDAPPEAAGQRSDAFNPALHPSAPGVPHALGNASVAAAPQQPMTTQARGVAPGTSATGAPLDLSSLAGSAPVSPPAQVPNAAPMGAPPQGAPMAPAQQAARPQGSQLPPPPPRNTSATGVRLATLPPSASPKDEYDLGYGYVLHKNYELAEQTFRNFLKKYPQEKKLTPQARYWLGESQFQQKRYRDAAETFLAVTTKYEHAGKAPDALLRLGQSLAAMHQKEAACAAFAEVGRKYPRAASSVKHGVSREQKRAHC